MVFMFLINSIASRFVVESCSSYLSISNLLYPYFLTCTINRLSQIDTFLYVSNYSTPVISLEDYINDCSNLVSFAVFVSSLRYLWSKVASKVKRESKIIQKSCQRYNLFLKTNRQIRNLQYLINTKEHKNIKSVDKLLLLLLWNYNGYNMKFEILMDAHYNCFKHFPVYWTVVLLMRQVEWQHVLRLDVGFLGGILIYVWIHQHFRCEVQFCSDSKFYF